MRVFWAGAADAGRKGDGADESGWEGDGSEDESEARKREPHYSAVRSQLSLVPAIVYTRLQN